VRLRSLPARVAKATGKLASKPRPTGRRRLTKPERAERRRHRRAQRPDNLLPPPTPEMAYDDPEKLRLRYEVIEAAGHRCLNCGRSYLLTLDHIVPLCVGGGNHRANLQCLCRWCNQAKGPYIWAPDLKSAA
jgi:5-methylcytosine-specific restriction endonuclease McrA